MTQNVWHQLRANTVALTSLAVALTALGYNTWRNERTERNRNVRVAAFEVLKQLGELQLVVNAAFFAKDGRLGHQMAGWGPGRVDRGSVGVVASAGASARRGVAPDLAGQLARSRE
jgi:hypothetical protein